MDKSYVTLEQQVCVVCGQPFDTGALLLDRRLRNKFEHKTITGFGMCPEDEAKRQKGYIAMVACRAPRGNQTHLKQEEADRTGRVMHMKKEAFQNIMNVPLPPGGLCFIDDEAMSKIEAMYEAVTQREDKKNG